MKKIVTFLFVTICIAIGCNSNKMTVKLDIVDSLLFNEQYDTADTILSEIDTSLLNNSDKAHYYLCKKQLACVLQKNDTSHMLDSIVIPYYIEMSNKEKLAEAFYYKAYDYIIANNISEAVNFYKRSEDLAYQTDNHHLQFKVVESLAYVNSVSGNRLLQCDYLRKAIKLANIINNKNWLTHSYIEMAYAQSKLGQDDSIVYYCQKAADYKNFVSQEDKQALLCNIAYLYKYSQPDVAKKYYEEALRLKESPLILGHLANIFYNEGHQEKAYQFWKKALTIDDNFPKDNFIHNLLEYDVEHGRTDSVCQYVNEIIAIKDSIIDNLRNDTIKDLQLRFDHEAAMREQETITNNWQKGLLAAILLITLLIAYIIIKRYREKAKMQEAQMKINDLMVQMRELEKSEEDNSVAIQRLNDQIRDTIDKEDPLAKKGKILYDQIVEGGTVSDWHKSEFEAFNHYYTVINFQKVNKLKRIKRKEKLTTQKLFFLILVEMGYDKKEITRIFNFKETSVNTLYFRTKPIE